LLEKIREREKKRGRRRKEEETKVLRAINIIFNFLDQFIHFCCSCRRREISKVIDKKS
jgi:hypothetical protein